MVEEDLKNLESALKWQLEGKLDKARLYNLVIAYNRPEITAQELNILGAYNGDKVIDAIKDSYELFLNEVKSFGILIEAQGVDEVYNFEIIMPKEK